MKKISVITIHCQTNFGSAFQAYALCKYISEMGYQCELIDYRPDYIVNNFGSGIKGFIKKVIAFFSDGSCRKKYDNFIKKYTSLSVKSYKSFQDLKEERFDSDIFIAGSDQLWNVGYQCGNDDSYKLLFQSNIPKISYATSLNTKIMNKEDLEYLKSSLKDFRSISLREYSSVLFFNEQLGINASWVCDPVFLINRDVYESMCNEIDYNDYILIYLVDDFDLLKSVVDIIYRRTGLKIVYACGTVPKCKCDYHFKNPGPIDMLSLIKHAKYIITGSFHATSFSHIFQKNFIVINPNNSERIKSLLSLSGLENRIIYNYEQCNNIDLDIDYTYAMTQLENFISDSKKRLKTDIDNIEDTNE